MRLRVAALHERDTPSPLKIWPEPDVGAEERQTTVLDEENVSGSISAAPTGFAALSGRPTLKT
jgi:hypothetical protein